MKKFLLFLLTFTFLYEVNAGDIKKVYSFNNYNTSNSGQYSKVTFEGTTLSGIPGEPSLPYKAISLMLPPGEKAVSIEVSGQDPVIIPGNLELFPVQYAQPISQPTKGFVKNEQLYAGNISYPSHPEGQLITNYLNGYAFALSTFTPVVYNPALGKVTYYTKVTVTVHTEKSGESEAALKNLSGNSVTMNRVKMLAQNPEMINLYPAPKIPATAYKLLIITPSQFEAGFSDLVNYYNSIGITSQFASTQDINSNMTGQDLQEKIRNYIIQEYQNNQIEYVLLGGDVEYIPYRGFYCYVISGTGYESNDIPADIYYSGLDGNWNANANDKWAEPGEEDVLPEISVARMPFSTTTELSHVIHKTVAYQSDPVPDEWKEPYLVGENLYDDPLTFGSDYLELIVDQHSDNGYTTFGIPSANNNITRLYDTLVSLPNNYYQWSTSDVIAGINEGKTFIHHVGHSNEIYMMRLFVTDITDANFNMVNGIDHNYTLMYSHGCICGAFDYNDCIAEASLTINNFLVGGVFNSRYGWFNQGTSDGPSEHLHREFISAMYNDTVPETHLGSAHTISKIMTAPFIALPGEFEPGAQRWCMYDCNALGDPTLKIWTDEPVNGINGKDQKLSLALYPDPAKDHATLGYFLKEASSVRISLINELGQTVKVIANSDQQPGKQIMNLSLSELPGGIYFCKVETKGSSAMKKLLIVK